MQQPRSVKPLPQARQCRTIRRRAKAHRTRLRRPCGLLETDSSDCRLPLVVLRHANRTEIWWRFHTHLFLPFWPTSVSQRTKIVDMDAVRAPKQSKPLGNVCIRFAGATTCATTYVHLRHLNIDQNPAPHTYGHHREVVCTLPSSGPTTAGTPILT